MLKAGSNEIQEIVQDIGIPSRVREGYTPLGYTDHETSSKVMAVKPKGPHCCVQFCMVLSAAGILFLTIIGFILWSNSIYLPMGLPKGQSNSSKAGGVFGGVVLYSITLSISVVLHLRAKKSMMVYKNSSNIHEAIEEDNPRSSM